MHTDDGTCVGEFDGPGGDVMQGWYVWARPTRRPDGTLGVETAVVEEGGKITRIPVPIEVVEDGL